MAKRKTGLKPHVKSKKSKKTAKRIAAKHKMLEEKATKAQEKRLKALKKKK